MKSTSALSNNLSTSIQSNSSGKPVSDGSHRSPRRVFSRRLVGVAAIVWCGFVLAACGGDTGGERVAVNGTESQISARVVTQVELAMDLSRSELVFSDPIALEPSDCFLHGAWQDQVLEAPVAHFVQLPDESTLQGPGEGVAEDALQICFDRAGLSPSADAVAAVVLDLEVTPTQLQLLTPNMATFLDPYGIEYEPPTLVENGEWSTTTFFANDFQVVGVLQVTATRTGGVLSVEYDLL